MDNCICICTCRHTCVLHTSYIWNIYVHAYTHHLYFWYPYVYMNLMHIIHKTHVCLFMYICVCLQLWVHVYMWYMNCMDIHFIDMVCVRVHEFIHDSHVYVQLNTCFLWHKCMYIQGYTHYIYEYMYRCICVYLLERKKWREESFL